MGSWVFISTEPPPVFALEVRVEGRRAEGAGEGEDFVSPSGGGENGGGCIVVVGFDPRALSGY